MLDSYVEFKEWGVQVSWLATWANHRVLAMVFVSCRGRVFGHAEPTRRCSCIFERGHVLLGRVLESEISAHGLSGG